MLLLGRPGQLTLPADPIEVKIFSFDNKFHGTITATLNYGIMIIRWEGSDVSTGEYCVVEVKLYWYSLYWHSVEMRDEWFFERN